MTRFKIAHPADLKLIGYYGHDTALGWWCEVRRAGRVVEAYDDLKPGNSDLQGVLAVLIRHRFFSELNVYVAYAALPHVADVAEMVSGEGETVDAAVRSAAIVIINLKNSAAD